MRAGSTTVSPILSLCVTFSVSCFHPLGAKSRKAISPHTHLALYIYIYIFSSPRVCMHVVYAIFSCFSFARHLLFLLLFFPPHAFHWFFLFVFILFFFSAFPSEFWPVVAKPVARNSPGCSPGWVWLVKAAGPYVEKKKKKTTLFILSRLLALCWIINKNRKRIVDQTGSLSPSSSHSSSLKFGCCCFQVELKGEEDDWGNSLFRPCQSSAIYKRVGAVGDRRTVGGHSGAKKGLGPAPDRYNINI